VPIPLTKKWFLDFGFRMRLTDAFVLPIYSNGISWDFILEIENKFFVFDNFAKIKYVHQLQNLFFAITGEELTIKD
jgi:hypothetical protein